MKLTNEEKEVLCLALEQLDKYYEERENTCREFKWICKKHMPQSGDEYVANKNVFDIQNKTISDIKEAKAQGRKVIMNIVNNS